MSHGRQIIRAYLRDMPGMSEAKQRARAEADGATIFYGGQDRATWVRSLRPGHTGWVWRLSWLAISHGTNVRPIADYARIISELSIRIGEGARVIVGDGSVSSDDRSAWFQAVIAGANQVRSGRMITRREAKRRGKMGGQVRHERSAASLLLTTHASQLAMVRGYWRSQAWPTREARADAINADLETMGLARLGSWQTIRRALKQLDE